MLTRRQLLASAWAAVLLPPRGARAAVEQKTGTYTAEVELLYGVMSFRLTGTSEEAVDRARGRYAVKLAGQGDGITNAVESNGVLRAGRWAPVRTHSVFVVQGREAQVDVAYDYDQRTVAYKSRSETFFLRRLRVADDVVAIPHGLHVDDVISATLNYADERWPAQADGTLLTHVVRRRRPSGEGPDDIQKTYRAELVPFVLKVVPDPETGRPSALFDLTRFSSWARESRPARIVFDARRRPATITSSLILGTSVNIRLAST
jgi:hypothetical protein